MKKNVTPMVLTVLAIVALVFTVADATEEPGSIQKIMKERAAGLGLMIRFLDARKFDLLAKKADELAMETKKTGENLKNPEAKEITLSISSLAEDIYKASTNNEEETIKIRLGEIRNKCGECHMKFRK